MMESSLTALRQVPEGLSGAAHLRGGGGGGGSVASPGLGSPHINARDAGVPQCARSTIRGDSREMILQGHPEARSRVTAAGPHLGEGSPVKKWGPSWRTPGASTRTADLPLAYRSKKAEEGAGTRGRHEGQGQGWKRVRRGPCRHGDARRRQLLGPAPPPLAHHPCPPAAAPPPPRSLTCRVSQLEALPVRVGLGGDEVLVGAEQGDLREACR